MKTKNFRTRIKVICNVKVREDLGRSNFTDFKEAKSGYRIYIKKNESLLKYDKQIIKEKLPQSGYPSELKMMLTGLGAKLGKQVKNTLDSFKSVKEAGEYKTLGYYIYYHHEEQFFSIIYLFTLNPKLVPIADFRFKFGVCEQMLGEKLSIFYVTSYDIHKNFCSYDDSHSDLAPCTTVDQESADSVIAKGDKFSLKKLEEASTIAKLKALQDDDAENKGEKPANEEQDSDESLFSPKKSEKRNKWRGDEG